MIIDLQRFVETERPYWAELETMLDRLETTTNLTLTLEQVQRFHQLYERTSADLARITTFSVRAGDAPLPGTSGGARLMGKFMRRGRTQRRIFPLQWFFQTLAANVPAACPRVLSVGRDHAGGLRVRRFRAPCSIRIRATSRWPFGHDQLTSERAGQRRGEPRSATGWRATSRPFPLF